MSVRNILDGTIPVGGSGGLTPESDIQVNHVYSNLGFHTPGIFGGKEVRLTHELTVPKINIGTYATTDDSEITSKITEEGITTPALTVGSLNLFAEDQVLNETMQFDFTDGSRTITSVQAKAEATYLSITQYLHLFQLTFNNLTGMPTTLIEFSVTIPKILPTSNFTLHDAVSVLLADTMPVGCALTIKATKGESLVVTFSFNTALQNPSSLSARFLREMP